MTRDLIVFAEDWGGLPSSTQHLMGHVAQHRKVLWVNSIGLRSPQLNRKDIQRVWQKLTAKKISSSSTQAMAVPVNLTVINPSTLPAPRSKFARKLASEMLSHQLKPIINANKLHDPIFWTSLPTAVDVVDKLELSSLVYYCGDDFSSLAGVDHDTVALRERELIARADLILAVSDTLYQRLYSTRTQLIPHGVDYDLFSSPLPAAADFPQNGRPTAGFYGSISQWLDYDLLEKIISKLPNWNFVFIGNISENAAPHAARLATFENTFFLGARPHHQLPSYSQHWAASLLPFLDNAQINSCNPLKLLEYLAAGRPVISTPFPALKSHLRFVNVVHSPQEAIIALENSRTENNNFTQQLAVKSHTWQARAEKLEKWLDKL